MGTAKPTKHPKPTPEHNDDDGDDDDSTGKSHKPTAKPTRHPKPTPDHSADEEDEDSSAESSSLRHMPSQANPDEFLRSVGTAVPTHTEGKHPAPTVHKEPTSHTSVPT